MFDSKLPVSFYSKIAALNKEHGIYIVQHRETGKIYVKKLMSSYDLAVYEELFKRQLRGLPHIYAMYEEAHVLTVIEEYISGDTLQEVLDICGRIPETDVIHYICSLCDILSQLHLLHPPIIHRDIKPSNIILTEDGRIILIDLNAAKQADESKRRDTRLLGTKGFAAPEQYGFGSSSPQTDIYALGKLITTLLTGDSDRDVTGKLRPIVDKCLQMNPKERFQSAAQLRSALQKLL